MCLDLRQGQVVKATPHPSLHMMLWSRTHKYLGLECCFNAHFLRSFCFIFGTAQFPHCRSLSGLQRDAKMLGMGWSPPPSGGCLLAAGRRVTWMSSCSLLALLSSEEHGDCSCCRRGASWDSAGRQMWSGWMGWVGALGFLPKTALFMSVTVQPHCGSHRHPPAPAREPRMLSEKSPALPNESRDAHIWPALASTTCTDSALPLCCLRILELKCLQQAGTPGVTGGNARAQPQN